MRPDDPENGSDSKALRKRARGRVIAMTGADSFLGRSLLAMLEEDPTVSKIIAIDLVHPVNAGPKTRSYELDLTQPSIEARLIELLAAEQVDSVVHLAFLANPTNASTFAHELESVGTMHLLNACRAHPSLRKFVLWSQTILYGAHPSNPNYLTEEHPLKGIAATPFVSDKIEAERETLKFAEAQPSCCVVVLRLAPIIGPTVRNYVTKWLSRRFPPVLMGFDPLVQLLHETDAVAAFKLALDRDVSGTFNIVGEGVLPLSTVVRLASAVPCPVPAFFATRMTSLLWLAHLVEAPPAFLRYLRYLCVADGSRAREVLGFRPAYSTKEAVLDFEGALRLRQANLLQEVFG